MKRVVIVGGGFGGLAAARALRRLPVEVTLVDRQNHFVFQPLLYQVATGGLSPANIAVPIRKVLRRQRNVRVAMSEVRHVDVGSRCVHIDSGPLPYDFLIVAVGAQHQYFGHDGWAPHAPGLKSIADATEIRRRILIAFERAELETDADRVREWLTFVIVGAGPTGVELAGALGEIAHQTMREDFRRIDPESASIILVDAADRILGTYPEALSVKAAASLQKLGVTLRLGHKVEAIDEHSVTLSVAGANVRVPARTVVWAAGVRSEPLVRRIADQTGAGTDAAGRLRVGEDLSISGYPEVFVIGDAACAMSDGGRPLPGVAPVAMQQGAWMRDVIDARLSGRVPRAFRYTDRGSMATIGRAAAVADFGAFTLSGFPAWVAWLVLHLVQLIDFDNRVLVLTQWAWNYLTYGRAARLIVHPEREIES